MNLQAKLLELSAYNVGCRFVDGFALVNITYDQNWNVVPPQNEEIECAPQDGVYYYWAPIARVDIDSIFECIQDTINYNMEIKEKLTLFQEKIDELKQLFAEEDLETLKTVEFKVKKRKKEVPKSKKEPTPQTKATRRPKKVTKEETVKEDSELSQLYSDGVDVEEPPTKEDNVQEPIE
ncbi:MAG: hypothetical protein LUD72_07445 [Bacteroidales bacterium]|nr:hypothetical protein [Bacteroidales bacterium]